MNLQDAEELMATGNCEWLIRKLTGSTVPWQILAPEEIGQISEAKGVVDTHRAKKAQGYVYLIQRGNLAKIGYSKNHDQRFRSLEMQCGELIKVLAVVPGTIANERNLHRRFKAYRQLGEWFVCRGEMAEFIRSPYKNMKAAMK